MTPAPGTGAPVWSNRVKLALGGEKFGTFKTLNASARNCKSAVSEINFSGLLL